MFIFENYSFLKNFIYNCRNGFEYRIKDPIPNKSKLIADAENLTLSKALKEH